MILLCACSAGEKERYEKPRPLFLLNLSTLSRSRKGRKERVKLIVAGLPEEGLKDLGWRAKRHIPDTPEHKELSEAGEIVLRQKCLCVAHRLSRRDGVRVRVRTRMLRTPYFSNGRPRSINQR